MAFGCAQTNSWVNSIFIFAASATFSFLSHGGLWPLVLTEPCYISTKEWTKDRTKDRKSRDVNLFFRYSGKKPKMLLHISPMSFCCCFWFCFLIIFLCKDFWHICPSVAIFLVCPGFASLLLCEDWWALSAFPKAVGLEIQKSTN